MIVVRQYVSPDGTNPFGEWFDALDYPAAARVPNAILRKHTGAGRTTHNESE